MDTFEIIFRIHTNLKLPTQNYMLHLDCQLNFFSSLIRSFLLSNLFHIPTTKKIIVNLDPLHRIEK